MSGRADHLVLATPVVAIPAQGRVGEIWQVTHVGAGVIREFVDQKKARRSSGPYGLVEPGGIEPPSASHHQVVLHA